jgi:hypothetical protein
MSWGLARYLDVRAAPSPGSAVLLPRVRGCSDRRNDREQNGREDRGSKQDGYAVHGKLLASPGRSTCPPIVVACKWVRRCSNPAEISALLLIRDGLWSVGASALHQLGEGDHTSRMPRSHSLRPDDGPDPGSVLHGSLGEVGRLSVAARRACG